MNAPDRYELLVVPDGVRKVTMRCDERLPNTAIFTMLKEDHTLGNLLTKQLLKNKKVLFAAYRVPHPLEHNIWLRVQTTDDTTPVAVLQEAVQDLIGDLSTTKTRFELECARAREAGQVPGPVVTRGRTVPTAFHRPPPAAGNANLDEL